MGKETTYNHLKVENMTIRSMSLGDLAGAMRLSIAEGWNQTEKDWRLFIEDPANVCLLAESDNKVIGTTTAINYANNQAWVGMVLVDKEYRGLGVSKSLLSRIFEILSSSKSIKLDATEAGQPVYQKFGFKNEYLISRMINPSVMDIHTESDGKIEAIRAADFQEIIVFDERVFGVNRKQLIGFLLQTYPKSGWLLKKENKIAGFALGREGYRYHQIGPVVASSASDAKMLISKSLEKLNHRPVVVDVLCDKKELVEWLNSLGFTRQRDFVRMYKEENYFPGETDMLYLICGPEFG